MKAIPYVLHVLTIIALFSLVAHRPYQTNFGKITVEEFEMVDSQVYAVHPSRLKKGEKLCLE